MKTDHFSLTCRDGRLVKRINLDCLVLFNQGDNGFNPFFKLGIVSDHLLKRRDVVGGKVLWANSSDRQSGQRSELLWNAYWPVANV